MMQDTILIIDDDQTFAARLKTSLEKKLNSLNWEIAFSASEALEIQKKLKPAVIILDLEICKTQGVSSGFELIENLLSSDDTVRIIVLTGYEDQENGIQSIKKGAASFLNKPPDVEHLLALVLDAKNFSNLKRELKSKLSHSRMQLSLPGFFTCDPQMDEILKISLFAASNTLPVLILGETGTGKGVLARALHLASSRAKQNFVRFQPNFVSQDLVSSEIFGHQKGSFTGAVDKRNGLLEEAHRGTFFIDEFDELPNETQVSLLNVIQERSYRKLGGSITEHSDFRLISASNCKIKEALETGKIRKDFYHRISSIVIELSPLRERLQDILFLANIFLDNVSSRERIKVISIEPSAINKLEDYLWPGNVRELQAVIESAALLAGYQNRTSISADDIRFKEQSFKKSENYSTHYSSHDSSQQEGNDKEDGNCNSQLLSIENLQLTPELGQGLREITKQFEENLVRDALNLFEGNQTKTAKYLNIDRTALRRIIDRLKE